MNSGQLYELFRSDVVDTAAPYLWSDTEVFTYMNDAYRMFVRKIGGIADVSSDITQIPVVAGEMYASVSPLILRFNLAYLVSTGQKVEIVNQTDTRLTRADDYGQTRTILMDRTSGAVRYMVIGEERTQEAGKVRWVRVPDANDTVATSVYRLPLDTIEEGNMDFTFPDIGLEHVEHLMLHMKAKAYGKQDAECFDRAKRDEFKLEFERYCAGAKAEADRYKSKVRVVEYGGL